MATEELMEDAIRQAVEVEPSPEEKEAIREQVRDLLDSLHEPYVLIEVIDATDDGFDTTVTGKGLVDPDTLDIWSMILYELSEKWEKK